MKQLSIDNEKLLVENLKNGSIEAFEGLYKHYSLRLFHFGLKYMKSEVEAEGLVQEVFSKIWENRSTLKTALSFKSYIFTIAFNFIRKYFIKQSRLREYLQSDDGRDVFDFETSQQIDYKSMLDFLNTLIDQLPEKRRAIFIKSRIEDLPVKEIARQMSISPKTVENQLTSALKFIKENWRHDNLSALLFYILFIVRIF